jgi:hypothetical protein
VASSSFRNIQTSDVLTRQRPQFHHCQSFLNRTMAPKRNARDVTPSTVSHSQTSTTTVGSTTVSPKAPSRTTSNQTPADIALGIWQNYLDTTPQRTKLIDVFMAFLVTVGVLQFVYCVIAGNYVRCSLACWRIDSNVQFSHSMPSCRDSRRLLDSLFSLVC